MMQPSPVPHSAMPIVALDLDGTLLNSRKEISPRTLSALLDVQARGATLVIASGRPPCGSAPFARQLELATHGGYVIAFNGAVILECRTGKKLFEQMLQIRDISTIHALIRHPSCTMLTYADDDIITEDASNPYVQYAARINQMTVRQTAHLPSTLHTPVPKCIIAGPAEELDILEAATTGSERTTSNCSEQASSTGSGQASSTGSGQATASHLALTLPMSIVRSEPFFLEFMPEGVDKGASLAHLLAITDRSAQSLTAFGDSYNDATMLSLAGTSVAMQNARTEIRAAASFTTASNDDDGIARFLESHDIFL